MVEAESRPRRSKLLKIAALIYLTAFSLRLVDEFTMVHQWPAAALEYLAWSKAQMQPHLAVLSYLWLLVAACSALTAVGVLVGSRLSGIAFSCAFAIVLMCELLMDVETCAGRMPTTLDIHKDGSVFVSFGATKLEEVETVRLDEKANLLSLDNIRGDIGAPEAAHYPYKLQLALNLRGQDKLSGSVCANSFETLPDRMGNLLCYWVELQRNPRPTTQ